MPLVDFRLELIAAFNVPMSLPGYARHHPLKFLVYLEWILLFIVVFGELPAEVIHFAPRRPGLNWLCWLILVILGRRIPTQPRSRLFYIGFQLALVAIAGFLGGIRLFYLLYIVLLIRTCFLFNNQMRMGLTGLVIGLSTLTHWYRFRHFPVAVLPFEPRTLGVMWFSIAFLVGLILIFLQLLVGAVLSAHDSQQQLTAANEKLHRYALQVEEMATIQERNRIAREIHDALGHSLTAVNLQVDAALRLFHADPEEAQTLLREAKALGSRALQEVRTSVTSLRSDPLAERSLEELIDSLAVEFKRSTQIQPRTTIDIQIPLKPVLKAAIYRIVQEALTNISKYAVATEVSIEIRSERFRRLTLNIKDNGKGFNPEQNTTGFGLQGMRERTQALSGQFKLRSAPRQGCEIRVTIPLVGVNGL